MDISLETLEDAVALAAEIDRLEKRLKELFGRRQPLMDISLEKLQQAVTLANAIEHLEKQLQLLFNPSRNTSKARASSRRKQSLY